MYLENQVGYIEKENLHNLGVFGGHSEGLLRAFMVGDVEHPPPQIGLSYQKLGKLKIKVQDNVNPNPENPSHK